MKTYQSSNTIYMHPELFKKYQEFLQAANSQNIFFKVVQVMRLQEYQDILYKQGRTKLDVLNQYRKEMGLYQLSPKENKIVTWTHSSKHILKTFPEYDNKQYSEAFDIAVLKNNKIDYTDLTPYKILGNIAESCGLTWGGKWKTPDYPHYQI